MLLILNSWSPSYDDIWCHRTWPTLVQVVACGLFGILSLPDPMMAYSWHSTGQLGTMSSEILIKLWSYYLVKVHLKMSSVKWQPFYSDPTILILIVLSHIQCFSTHWGWENLAAPVCCRYNVVNVLKNIDERHPVAHLSGQGTWL